MAKLIWDAVGQRKYENGVSKGVLYKATQDDPYGKGVAWNGLSQMTESPEGAELTDLYADGIKYASFRSTEIYKITAEAYTYPDEFAECDGSVEPTEGVYVGQQMRKPFGLCYRTEIGDDVNEAGDGNYKLHLVYGCTASPSERTHATINDSPDVQTMSWEINTTPVEVVGYKPSSCLTIDSSKVAAAKLTALEKILYGDESAEARLPLPSEVITLLSAA